MKPAPLPPPRPEDQRSAKGPSEPVTAPDRRQREDRRDPKSATTKLKLGRSTFRERRLGARLDRELEPIGAVLHGCRLPEAAHRIDHLVVAPSGIWTVLADHAHGRVSSTGRSDGRRVLLGDDDQSARITSAGFAAERVRQLLVPIGFDWVDVHPTVCFTNAKWGVVARELEVADVRVTWGRALVDRVATPGPIMIADARMIASALAGQLVVDDVSSRRRT